MPDDFSCLLRIGRERLATLGVVDKAWRNALYDHSRRGFVLTEAHAVAQVTRDAGSCFTAAESATIGWFNEMVMRLADGVDFGALGASVLLDECLERVRVALEGEGRVLEGNIFQCMSCVVRDIEQPWDQYRRESDESADYYTCDASYLSALTISESWMANGRDRSQAHRDFWSQYLERHFTGVCGRGH